AYKILLAKLNPSAKDLCAQKLRRSSSHPGRQNRMERPLWNRIQEIYYSTLPIPPSERKAYLTGACNDDPLLVREVTSLLHADDTADGFLEASVFELGLRVISSSGRS